MSRHHLCAFFILVLLIGNSVQDELSDEEDYSVLEDDEQAEDVEATADRSRRKRICEGVFQLRKRCKEN